MSDMTIQEALSVIRQNTERYKALQRIEDAATTVFDAQQNLSNITKEIKELKSKHQNLLACISTLGQDLELKEKQYNEFISDLANRKAEAEKKMLADLNKARREHDQAIDALHKDREKLEHNAVTRCKDLDRQIKEAEAKLAITLGRLEDIKKSL